MVTLAYTLLSLAPLALAMLGAVLGALLSYRVAAALEAPCEASRDTQAWVEDLDAELSSPDVDAAWPAPSPDPDAAPPTLRSPRHAAWVGTYYPMSYTVRRGRACAGARAPGLTPPPRSTRQPVPIEV